MFYRNDSSISEPYNVSLPGCSQRCPLQDFVNLTRDVIPQDRNKECQIKKEATDTGKAIMYINKFVFYAHKTVNYKYLNCNL